MSYFPDPRKGLTLEAGANIDLSATSQIIVPDGAQITMAAGHDLAKPPIANAGNLDNGFGLNSGNPAIIEGGAVKLDASTNVVSQAGLNLANAFLINSETMKTTTYSVSSTDAIIAADTTSASFTVTLQSTPGNNRVLFILDPKGTWTANPLTLGRNGKLINGAASDLVLSVNGASVMLFFDTGVGGWWVLGGK